MTGSPVRTLPRPLPRAVLRAAAAGDPAALDILRAATPTAGVVDVGLLLSTLGLLRPRQPSEAARCCAAWIDQAAAREPAWSPESVARQWLLLARACGVTLALPADPDAADVAACRTVARRAARATG